MKFINSGDPDILQTRSGGGCLSVFGLPFLFAGIFVILAGLGVVPTEGERPPWFFIVPFGSIFVIVGGAFVFGRAGIIIDRRQKTIIHWRGLLIPMQRTTNYLEFYKHLSISKEIRRGKNSTTTVYPLRLEGNVDVKTINFSATQDYNETRKNAEIIAKFIRLPIKDSSTGKEIVREPDMLDESIREKAGRTGEKVALPNMPMSLTGKVRDENGATVIETSPSGFTAFHYIRMALPLLIIPFVLVMFGGVFSGAGENEPPFVRFIFIGFLSLFIIVPILFMFLKVFAETRRTYRIEVSRDLLRVEERGITKKTSREIPADELEELLLGDSSLPAGITRLPDGKYSISQNPQDDSGKYGVSDKKQVTVGPQMMSMISTFAAAKNSISARSDTTTIEIGKGLKQDELNYIYALIKQKLIE